LKKLEASPAINLYFQVLKSIELEQYLAFKNSSEFEDLGDKKKVKNSENSENLNTSNIQKLIKPILVFIIRILLKSLSN